MFLNNYNSIILSNMLAEVETIIVDNTGMERIIKSCYNTPNLTYFLQKVSTSYSSEGVIFGSGNTEVVPDNYRLSGDLITGISCTNKLSHWPEDSGYHYQITYSITNNNPFPITIGEIGIINYSIEPKYHDYHERIYPLIERTALQKPITIKASGGIGQIEYNIHVNPPSTRRTSADLNNSYGVKHNWQDPSTKLTRIGLAKDFPDPSPASLYEDKGSSPFDKIMPWAGMKKYNFINGVPTYSEDDPEFDINRYETMVYIPEFYYAVNSHENFSIMEWAISSTPQPGFKKHPGSGRYIGRYLASCPDDETIESKSGQNPAIKKVSDFCSLYERKIGNKWYPLDFVTINAIQLLYLIEYANFNSKETLGIGVDNKNSPSGNTDTAIYHTVKADNHIGQYRNIENIVGGDVGTIFLGLKSNEFWIKESLEELYPFSPNDGYIRMGGEISHYVRLRFGYFPQVSWAFIPGPDVDDNIEGAKYTATGYELNYINDYNNNKYIPIWGGGSQAENTWGFLNNRTIFSFFDEQQDNPSYSGSRALFVPSL